MHFRCNISFLALCPVLILAASRRNAEDQSCYTEVKNASSGTLEVKPESLTQNTCTWLIVSSVRALVLTVESVNLSNDAFLEVVVNGNPTLLPRQCNGCNVTFSGNIIKITYSELSNKGNSNGFVKPKKYLRVSTSNSSMSPTPELKKTYLKSNLTSLPHVPQSSLFVIRYRSLSNLECDPPSFPINYASFPFVEGSGLKLGSQIRYGCSRPYTPAQGSLLTATCVLNSTTSLPIWNNPSPLCMLPECDSSPIRFSLDDNQSSIILQQENLIVGTQKRCVWEIVTIPKKHIVAQIDLINFPTYLDFEKQSGGVLELYDGKMSDSRLLARLTGNVSAHPQIYFTLFDTLIISLHSEAPAHIVDHNGTTELDDNDYNFDISITLTAEVSLCKTPSLPANGNVKRQQLLDAPLDKRTAKNVVIAYSCNPGYKMYGSNRSSCLGNGKWSDHPPSCFPLRSFDDNVESDNATLTHNWKDLSSEDAISSEKFPQSRMPKNQRPHLQSTEEKTKLKDTKEAPNLKTKWEHLIPLPSDGSSMSDNSTIDSDVIQEHSGDDNEIVETSGAVAPHYPFSDEYDPSLNYPDEDIADPFSEEEEKPEESIGDNLSTTWEFPVIPVILGVGIPLILVLTIIGGCLMYRKLYPVRMSVGRRFETFENPIYKDKKRGTTSPDGTLLPGLSVPHSPAELQRLTVS